jgi:endonuclease/exonuclease/phosphatase family metal-dependent hydrolase
MKILLIAITSSFSFIAAIAQTELNVMTFNIRYDNPRDSLNAWTYRKAIVASQVLFHRVHLLGIQEALHTQVQDLKDGLRNYKYVGVGRADGKEKGEYSAIFYDTSRLQLLQTETFWLAEQTNVPGTKGWDAAIERIVTWGKFRDRKTKKTFFHFNTHFDHMGKVARRESAKLLLQKVKEIGGNTPCIITGDFNAHPADEPIQVIKHQDNPDRFIDSREISTQPHYGPEGTFNGFRSKETNNLPIDYIFIKKGIKVLQHATLSQTWEGRFSSDHFPVLAVLAVK